MSLFDLACDITRAHAEAVRRSEVVGPMDHEQARSFAQERPPSLAKSIEDACNAMSVAAAQIRSQDRRIAKLEAALARMVKEREECQADSEGHYPLPDCGCLECTVGTVPNHLNTGLCGYHAAKDLLR